MRIKIITNFRPYQHHLSTSPYSTCIQLQLNLNLFTLISGDMTDSPDTDKPDENELTNEISAPYEVPQFPIEQIEKKLQIQRQLNEK